MGPLSPFPISLKLLDQQVLPHQVHGVFHQNKLYFLKLVEVNNIDIISNPFKGCLEVTHNDKAMSKLASGKQGLLLVCIIFLTLSTL